MSDESYELTRARELQRGAEAQAEYFLQQRIELERKLDQIISSLCVAVRHSPAHDAMPEFDGPSCEKCAGTKWRRRNEIELDKISPLFECVHCKFARGP